MCHQNCGIYCDLGSENMKFTFYFRFYYLPIKTLAFVVKTCQDGKVNNILSTYHGVFSLGSRHEYCDYSRRLSIKCYPSKHYNPRKMYKNHCLSLPEMYQNYNQLQWGPNATAASAAAQQAYITVKKM